LLRSVLRLAAEEGSSAVWAHDVFGRIGGGFAHWGTAGSGIKLRVDQHNVMQAARMVMEESTRFRAKVNARLGGLQVDPVGGDPVSMEAALVLNTKFWDSADSYYARCLDYADMLEKLAHQLGEAAKTYGHTEEQVEAMFTTAKQQDAVSS
jgi:hypothetical protein